MSDNSNAELGIAINDARAAQQRLSGKGGFQQQHDWSIRYVNQRIISTVAFIGLIGFVMVWATDTSNLIRYSVSALLVLLAIGFIVAMNRKKTRVEQIREQQLKQYSRSGETP